MWKRTKRGMWKGLEGGGGEREECCNYIMISKIKIIKDISILLLKHRWNMNWEGSSQLGSLGAKAYSRIGPHGHLPITQRGRLSTMGDFLWTFWHAASALVTCVKIWGIWLSKWSFLFSFEILLQTKAEQEKQPASLVTKEKATTKTKHTDRKEHKRDSTG